MTPVAVLEKTGDLCYRCYRPAGYQIIRALLWLAVLVLIGGGGVIAWKMFSKSDDTATTSDGQSPRETPKEFTADQKISILKRRLLDGVPVSQICKTFGVSPGEYQQWEQMFFQAGERAFDPVTPREPGSVERRITTIEQKIQMAGKVLGELRENVTQLRKESGHYDASPAQKFILDSVGPPPLPRGK
jgi:transposase-like protein